MQEDKLHKIYSRYGGFWELPGMLDYCYLVNPYFTRSGIIDEMAGNFRTLVCEYPAGMGVNSSLASACWNVKPEYIIPGNGAAELIKALMDGLEGSLGLVRPTFEEYPNRLAAGDASRTTEVFIPSDPDFRYTAEDLVRHFSEHPVDNLLLINPDNPSGNFIDKRGLLKLAEWTRGNGTKLILDESFVDFSRDFETSSCLDDNLLESYPQMCVIKSISKSYGVPGLRLGILASADTALISRLKRQVSIWNINSFAEYFMEIFPEYREDYNAACRTFIEVRDEFEAQLRTIPFLRTIPSQANFFMLEVLQPFGAKQLCEKLLEEHNILASALQAKKGIQPDRYIRVAVRSREDNSKFIEALKKLSDD